MKGLVAGFRDDFAVAASILVPQFEHAIRCVLESIGVTVTRLNTDLGQEDRSIGALLREKRLTEIFPENLIDEIYALLDDRFGPRFRHDLAHGRLNSLGLSGQHSIYLWWLVFHIVTTSFLEMCRQRAEIDGEQASTAQGEKPEGDKG